VTAMREQTRQIEPLLARLAGRGPPGVTVSAG
jgi:hypothetical protein